MPSSDAVGPGVPRSRAGDSGVASTLLLDVRDVAVRFGGIVALDGVSFTIENGPDPRADRPQRRRQDDAVQLRQPALHAQLAAISCSRGSRCLTRPPHRIAEIGIARTFQNLALFGPQSVIDNVRIGGHAQSRSDFVSDALRLPWVRRQESELDRNRLVAAQAARARGGRVPAGRGLAARHPQAGRAGPRPRGRAQAAAARRAGRRAEPRGGRRARRPDPPHARRAPRHRAAGRASHEPGDVGLGQGRRARFRPQDRRRHPGPGAAGRGGDPRLSRHRPRDAHACA